MIRYKNGNNETDNLKFLLSLLVIIGTFLYTIHIYFQNTAINIDLYEYVKIFISVVLCYLFIIILYITLKSFSIEIQDINTKKYLNLLSSSLYLIGLSFFIMIIIFIISFYICLKIDNSFSSEMYERIPFLNIFITSLVLIKIIKREVCTDNKTILDIMNSIDNPKYLGIILISGIFMIFTANKLIIYSVIIICIVYVAYSEKKKLTLELLPVSYKIFTTVIVPILVVLFFIISASSLFLFSGQISSYIMEIHLTNDMESIYYKNDIQIPVTIQVTGSQRETFRRLSGLETRYGFGGAQYIQGGIPGVI